MKQSVSVEIAGQVLSIRSDEGPKYVQELADYVDAHLREIGARVAPTRSSGSPCSLPCRSPTSCFDEKDLRQRYQAASRPGSRGSRTAIAAHEADPRARAAADPETVTHNSEYSLRPCPTASHPRFNPRARGLDSRAGFFEAASYLSAIDAAMQRGR